jgi:hypothetical protein
MTKTLTQNRKILHAAAREEVVGVLREIFNDSDYGSSLRNNAVRRLKQSARSKELGNIKDLREVLRQYNRA